MLDMHQQYYCNCNFTLQILVMTLSVTKILTQQLCQCVQSMWWDKMKIDIIRKWYDMRKI